MRPKSNIKVIMKENLVIVESPAKAKTIEKFLGDKYKVLSSYGHIRDLKKRKSWSRICAPMLRRPRRSGSHPMKTAREKPSHGIFVRF